MAKVEQHNGPMRLQRLRNRLDLSLGSPILAAAPPNSEELGQVLISDVVERVELDDCDVQLDKAHANVLRLQHKDRKTIGLRLSGPGRWRIYTDRGASPRRLVAVLLAADQ